MDRMAHQNFCSIAARPSSTAPIVGECTDRATQRFARMNDRVTPFCLRRHDSLVVFDVLENGDLRGPVDHVPTGRHPRNFNIDPSGQWLLVGNAHDDNVAVYSISPDTGVPIATGEKIAVPTPTRILFAQPQRLTATTGTDDGAVASAVAVVHSDGTTVRVATDS
jgi:hypothetical protein